MREMSVDFPDPDAPMSATMAPRGTEKVTSSSTRTSRSKHFETRVTSMSASLGKPDLLPPRSGLAAPYDSGMNGQDGQGRDRGFSTCDQRLPAF
jgi:hypothetical protein